MTKAHRPPAPTPHYGTIESLRTGKNGTPAPIPDKPLTGPYLPNTKPPRREQDRNTSTGRPDPLCGDGRPYPSTFTVHPSLATETRGVTLSRQ